jgi:hypothetical protein
MNDFSKNKTRQLPQTSIIEELVDINDLLNNRFSWFNFRFDDYQCNKPKSSLHHDFEASIFSPFSWSLASNSMDKSNDFVTYDTSFTPISFRNPSSHEASMSNFTTLKNLMYDSVSLDSDNKNRNNSFSCNSVDNNVLPRFNIGCITSTTVPKLEEKQDAKNTSYNSVTKSCGFLFSCTCNMALEDKTHSSQQTTSTIHNFSLNTIPKTVYKSKIPHIQSSLAHCEEKKIIDIWVDNLGKFYYILEFL